MGAKFDSFKAGVKTRVVDEWPMTLAGVFAGSVAGAIVSVQSGGISKEAIATGAAIGAVGAYMKSPSWDRIQGYMKGKKKRRKKTKVVQQ